jgi:hypothetical protein
VVLGKVEWQFDKTSAQVAKDINRRDLESYR